MGAKQHANEPSVCRRVAEAAMRTRPSARKQLNSIILQIGTPSRSIPAPQLLCGAKLPARVHEVKTNAHAGTRRGSRPRVRRSSGIGEQYTTAARGPSERQQRTGETLHGFEQAKAVGFRPLRFNKQAVIQDKVRHKLQCTGAATHRLRRSGIPSLAQELTTHNQQAGAASSKATASAAGQRSLCCGKL
jgi:hypothetical protein